MDCLRSCDACELQYLARSNGRQRIFEETCNGCLMRSSSHQALADCSWDESVLHFDGKANSMEAWFVRTLPFQKMVYMEPDSLMLPFLGSLVSLKAAKPMLKRASSLQTMAVCRSGRLESFQAPKGKVCEARDLIIDDGWVELGF